MLTDPLSFIAIIPDRLLWKANEMVAVSLSIFTVEGEKCCSVVVTMNSTF